MRVLVVTPVFPPEPREIYLELAQAFKAAGHEVEVLTGFPNWPGGKLYPGYTQRLIHREIIGDIETTRLPIFPNHSPGGIKRVINLLSLPASVFFLAPFAVRRPDHIHIVQQPFLVLAIRPLAFCWRAPLTMEVQDLWPDTFAATNTIKSAKALTVLDKVCSCAYRICTRIRVISPGFAEKLITRGVPVNKIREIPNWIDEVRHKPLNTSESNSNLAFPEGFNVLYAGSVGLPQALVVVLNAAEELHDRSDIYFIIAGDGVEKQALESEAKTRKLDHVLFVGSFPQLQMGSLYKQADALLVHLAANPLWEITIPSKIVSYLAYQKPILAGLTGDGKKVIEETRSGIVFTPGDGKSLAYAVRQLADMSTDQRQQLADAGRHAAENRFSIRAASRSLAEMIEGCH